MKVKSILIALILSPFVLISQNESKPPKLRIEPSFLSTKYELGDKTTPKGEVALHLKKFETDAYIKWKSADKADTNALIWSIIGLGGLVAGIISVEPENSLAGYGVAIVGSGVSLVCSINSKHRRQKAIDLYNTKFGY